MSIDYLFEVGYRHMDKESMEETRKLVVEKEKENIKNKVISFMTPEFTISIMETALELKEFPKMGFIILHFKKNENELSRSSQDRIENELSPMKLKYQTERPTKPA